MKRKQGAVILGTVLAAVVGLAGSVAAAPVGRSAAAAPVWGACPEPIAKAAPGLQCATVKVPLDYRKPTGKTIDLKVSRVASPNPQKRRGVLFLNPGGPGISALTMPFDLTQIGLPYSVQEKYDLIGMDTRGVGYSSPVDCKFTAAQGYAGNIPLWAENAARVAEDAKAAKAVADQCAANDKYGLLPHITTANTARDLDRIRAALGEKKASFFGASYGSALGAAYASMFPGTTDRVIIDSNTGDTALTRTVMRRFGLGAEQAFPGFARWVAARHGAYGLGRTPAEVRKTYFAIAGRLDKKPVAGFDGRLFRLLTFGSLYGETSYGKLASLWQSMRNPAAPAGPTDVRATPEPTVPESNFFSAFLAVTCGDSKWPSDVRTYQRSVAEDRQKYPIFGAASANITPCAFWTARAAEPQVAINDNGPANIVIMQNRRDVATPLVGGQIFRTKFAHRSRLVTVDDNQHGVYVYGGNACALTVGTAWLVDGKFPKDTDCAASPAAGPAGTLRGFGQR
ncbi:alpha/beta fold hydrolase [Actinoplanes sp. Pm04-4]|uniref:Alpha/beta fold hydrolase n=1 Tax=Paractinoplanes pyxinae TaxID=2997416 RepID=A0ABT4AS71_9ACTN|nr:alpha/beta fold hydrolase [Actinoplanes pyxinae]MCY1136570.1 alpha/beta fold hydrolase [Actinoplanes pyxinae]